MLIWRATCLKNEYPFFPKVIFKSLLDFKSDFSPVLEEKYLFQFFNITEKFKNIFQLAINTICAIIILHIFNAHEHKLLAQHRAPPLLEFFYLHAYLQQSCRLIRFHAKLQLDCRQWGQICNFQCQKGIPICISRCVLGIFQF